MLIGARLYNAREVWTEMKNKTLAAQIKNRDGSYMKEQIVCIG
jgi:hypothetical protein